MGAQLRTKILDCFQKVNNKGAEHAAQMPEKVNTVAVTLASLSLVPSPRSTCSVVDRILFRKPSQKFDP